jgi:hypothetical protein
LERLVRYEFPVVRKAAEGLQSRCPVVSAYRETRCGLGGSAEAHRQGLTHQVYAVYRRADPDALVRVLERARVYEPTVHEAAAAFGVDPEVLMGVGAAESALYPHDSADGGRGLFQITTAPAAALGRRLPPWTNRRRSDRRVVA